jgi:hypothetical protein
MRKLLGVVAMVCGFLSLGVFLPTIASAALIYDNGVPGSSGLGGTEMSTSFLAEDFTLTQAATLNLVRFWNSQTSPDCCYAGSITWGIYSNGDAKPGVPLAGPTNTTAVTRTLTGAVGRTEYQNDVALPSVLLSPGTYWLALHNGPLAPNGFLSFFWEWHSASSGDTSAQCDPSSTVTCLSTTDWHTASNQEYDFQLYGDAVVAPEPSTLLLLGSALPGLAGVLIHRRRESRSRL